MLHDKEALYIGIKCYDHPDSLSRVLSIRDDFNPNLDMVGVFIDTYMTNKMDFSLVLRVEAFSWMQRSLIRILTTYLI